MDDEIKISVDDFYRGLSDSEKNELIELMEEDSEYEKDVFLSDFIQKLTFSDIIFLNLRLDSSDKEKLKQIIGG